MKCMNAVFARQKNQDIQNYKKENHFIEYRKLLLSMFHLLSQSLLHADHAGRTRRASV